MDKTLSYYEENAEAFLSRTLASDMSIPHAKFLSLLTPGARILDLGCGSGRDSRAFLDLGYEVEAVDGASAMCAAAARLLGRPVRELLFGDLDYVDAFDGVWASASLLHVPPEEMDGVMEKIRLALRDHGTLFVSVKRGEGQGERRGRYFNDFTEAGLERLLKAHEFQLRALWAYEDQRPDGNECFVNALAQRL